MHDLRHSFAVRSLESCAHDYDAVRRHMTALRDYLGHSHIEHTYWYLEATPVLMRTIAAANEDRFLAGCPRTALAPHLTDYLVDHLPRHRNASAHTVATYAHSFTLLVRFAAKQRRCRPVDLQVEDLDPDLILAFLDHIEAGRQNSVSTRNARLAAVRSFFRYIEYKVPACLDQAQRIHALPRKRTEIRLADALTVGEIQRYSLHLLATVIAVCAIGRCFIWPMRAGFGHQSFLPCR